MYANDKADAVASGSSDYPFNCASCGHSAMVQVLGRARATTHGPASSGNAGEGVERADPQDLRSVVALARCPRCGSRNGRATWWFWAKALLIFLGVTAVAGLAALLTGVPWLWLLAVVGVPLIYIVDVRKRWMAIDTRVVFPRRRRLTSDAEPP